MKTLRYQTTTRQRVCLMNQKFIFLMFTTQASTNNRFIRILYKKRELTLIIIKKVWNFKNNDVNTLAEFEMYYEFNFLVDFGIFFKEQIKFKKPKWCW